MTEKQEELSEHTVLINGIPHTMMLTDEDAKRYESAEPSEKAKDPANKAKGAQNK